MSILAYHMVDPRFSWGVTRVPPRRFRKQIEFLLNRSYSITTLTSYLKSKNETQNQLALTFDDGYTSIFEHALPILREYNVPASVFINPGFVGQYNTWDVNLGGTRCRHLTWKQLELLRREGWEIGLHGLSHKDLTHLSPPQLEEEIALAQRLIVEKLGVCSKVISYPFGNVNSMVYDTAKRYGFAAGVVMSGGPNSVPAEYRIRRCGIYLGDLRMLVFFKVKYKNNFPVSSVQKVMDVCSNATVAYKQKSWQLY